jgi:hypothetical protein
MQITDILNQTGGLQSIARELGISEAEAASGASALAPAILGGFQNQVQNQPDGVDGLGSLLGQLGGPGLMDNVVAPQPTDVTPGNQLLGNIFGSKDTSRTVAQHAAAQTGLQPSILKKMLPMLTMLLAGYMARQAGSRAGAGGGMGGGLGSILGGMLGGGGLGGVLGGLGGAMGGGGNRPGSNPLNDILGMGRQ